MPGLDGVMSMKISFRVDKVQETAATRLRLRPLGSHSQAANKTLGKSSKYTITLITLPVPALEGKYQYQ